MTQTFGKAGGHRTHRQARERSGRLGVTSAPGSAWAPWKLPPHTTKMGARSSDERGCLCSAAELRCLVRQIFTPVPLFVAVLLSGCAVPPGQDAQPPETWSFAAAADGPARLLYGVDETDLVSLGFTCHAGSGEAQIVLFVSESEETWPEKLELRSGKAHEIFDLIPSSRAESPMLNAHIDPSAPVAVSLALTGRLETAIGGVTSTLDAHDGLARREISNFWRTCARRRVLSRASH